MNELADHNEEYPRESAGLRHIAIIMDGNGRWAKKRLMPRYAGHKSGVNAARKTIEECARRNIEVLTLFAFSSENWRRPKKEVGTLMDLFLTALGEEAKQLHKNNIRLRIVGDRTAFSKKLQNKIAEVEGLTTSNTGLQLVIAANYGGRWDIQEAFKKISVGIEQGEMSSSEISEQMISDAMCLSDLPEPDLFIRTGGEKRISNFLLWQLAYTELYFTDTLWPDFDTNEFERAISEFAQRQRRFGHTGEQVEQLKNA